MEQARAESGPGGVLPLDMETLIEPDLHTGISGRPTQPFTAPTRPFVPGQPTESRQATIDFESMSRRGLLSPLGEKTRIAEEYRLIKRFVLAKAFGRAGGRAENDTLVMVTKIGRAWCRERVCQSG